MPQHVGDIAASRVLHGGEGDEGGDTDESDVGEAGAVVIDVGVEGPEPCMAGWAEEAGAMLGWPAGGTTTAGAGCMATRSRRKSRSSGD